MQALIAYAPPTFMKPCLLISTSSVEHNGGSTAIKFIVALNPQDAMNKATQGEWIIIKEHKDIHDAKEFHKRMIDEFAYFESSYDIYLELYNKTMELKNE